MAVLYPPGEFLVQGTPWAVVWPVPDGGAEQVVERLQRGLRVGVERSGGTDISFGLRQIVDVAAKALSPGINDRTTAVHAVDTAAALLCLLATKDLRPTVVLADDGDRVLATLPQYSFADLLSLAYDQPRRYGSDDPQVTAALLQGLRALAWTADARHHDLIRGQLALLRAAVATQQLDPPAHAELDRGISDVEEALERRWPPPPESTEVGTTGHRIR